MRAMMRPRQGQDNTRRYAACTHDHSFALRAGKSNQKAMWSRTTTLLADSPLVRIQHQGARRCRLAPRGGHSGTFSECSGTLGPATVPAPFFTANSLGRHPPRATGDGGPRCGRARLAYRLRWHRGQRIRRYVVLHTTDCSLDQGLPNFDQVPEPRPMRGLLPSRPVSFSRRFPLSAAQSQCNRRRSGKGALLAEAHSA